MGKLSGEFREPNRKDRVTRCPSVSYARQLWLLVNTLGSYLKQRENTQINHIRNQCYYKYVIKKTSRGCKGSAVRMNSSAGSRTQFIFTCRQLIDHYATVPLVFGAVNLLHLKQFLYHRRCMKLVNKDTLKENQLKRVFQSYFALGSTGRSMQIRESQQTH